jgi:hypothetical protein
MRNLYECQMLEVCELLHWTPEQYCQHQYEQYEKFAAIATRYVRYPELKDWIRLSPVYRGFWNNEWEQRNRVEFINYAYYNSDNHVNVVEEYRYVHSADRLLFDELFFGRFQNIVKWLK